MDLVFMCVPRPENHDWVLGSWENFFGGYEEHRARCHVDPIVGDAHLWSKTVDNLHRWFPSVYVSLPEKPDYVNGLVTGWKKTHGKHFFFFDDNWRLARDAQNLRLERFEELLGRCPTLAQLRFAEQPATETECKPTLHQKYKPWVWNGEFYSAPPDAKQFYFGRPSFINRMWSRFARGKMVGRGSPETELRGLIDDKRITANWWFGLWSEPGRGPVITPSGAVWRDKNHVYCSMGCRGWLKVMGKDKRWKRGRSTSRRPRP